MTTEKDKNEEYLSLAHLVHTKRENLGLSAGGLAKKCGMKTVDIEAIEQGLDIFLSATVRQKLAKGLKLELEDIKKFETKIFVNTVNQKTIEEIKDRIIVNANNPNFKLNCPVCGEVMVTRIAKMYDLEDNLMLHPKARCSKCPFQIT